MKELIIEKNVTFEEATEIAKKQGITIVVAVCHAEDENRTRVLGF